MDDKTKAWAAGRRTHQFRGANGITIIIATHNQAALNAMVRDARDVYHNGRRWSFEEGEVIVDCGMRCALEEPRARLSYVIFDGERRVFLAEGAGAERRTEGGEVVQEAEPRVYRF